MVTVNSGFSCMPCVKRNLIFEKSLPGSLEILWNWVTYSVSNFCKPTVDRGEVFHTWVRSSSLNHVVILSHEEALALKNTWSAPKTGFRREKSHFSENLSTFVYEVPNRSRWVLSDVIHHVMTSRRISKQFVKIEISTSKNHF